MRVHLDAPGHRLYEEIDLPLVPREGETVEWKADTDEAKTFRVHHVVWFLGDEPPVVRVVLR